MIPLIWTAWRGKPAATSVHSAQLPHQAQGGSLKDVVVIGAGPAGIHAAYLLAQAGLDVVLFEAQNRVGDRAICSGVVGDEAFPRFDLPRQPILSDIRCIQAISPSGKKLEHRTDAPLAQVIDKAEFNRALAQRAVKAGVAMQLGCWVNSLHVDKHSVKVQYRPAESGPASLQARVAVITTGVNGSLNHGLGLARPRQFLRAVQAEMSLPPNGHGNATRVFVGQGVAPGAFGWEIPLGNNRWRVGLMTEDNPDPFFAQLVRRIAPDMRRFDIANRSQGNCPSRRRALCGRTALSPRAKPPDTLRPPREVEFITGFSPLNSWLTS